MIITPTNANNSSHGNTNIYYCTDQQCNGVIILKWYLVLHEIKLQYLPPAQRSCDQVEDFLQTQYLLVKIMMSLSDHTQDRHAVTRC